MMQNDTNNPPAAFQETFDRVDQMLENYNHSREQLNRQQRITQETLLELEATVRHTLTVHRRWLIALSLLATISSVAAGILTVKLYTAPPAATPATGNPVIASLPVKKAADTDRAPATAEPEVKKAPTTTSAAPKKVNLLSADQAEKTIKHRSKYALTYFKRAQFDYLAAKYIHPEKGVHFYPAGLKAAGASFTPQSFKNAMFNPVNYDWGQVAPDAPPIKHRFINYYKNHIYDQDFLAADKVHFNEIAFPGTHGLSAAAIAGKYPGCVFAEYQMEGKSLTLIFEQFDGPGVWYLVGVIHNE